VHLGNRVIIIANLVSLSTLVVSLALYFRFFKRDNTENR